MTASAPNPEPLPRQAARPPGRPWAVTANALLLLLQAGGLVGLAVLTLRPVGLAWRTGGPLFSPEHLAQATGLTFAALAILALSAALGLFRISPGAWLIAVLVQGGTLALALAYYFSPPPLPPYVYVLMIYSLVMVLYLHQADVTVALRPHLAHPHEHEPPPSRRPPTATPL
jgi:hypothetical protein